MEKQIDYTQIDVELEMLLVEVERRIRNIKILSDDIRKRLAQSKPFTPEQNKSQGKQE